MITREQALALKPGDILHSVQFNRNCQKWKVNGKVRTWKRDPNRIEIPLKHGLYTYETLTPEYFDKVTLESECEHCRKD